MAFEQTSFPDYSSFIHLSRYSRYDYNLKRRETWEETISRWFNFWASKYPELRSDILEAALSIHDLDVMPSMRSLMTAGPALDKDNVAGYNCAYEAIEGTGPKLELFTEEMQEAGFDEPITIQIKNPIAFDEAMYILMCGTGIGFSVERQYIANLPTVGKPLDRAIYRRTNKNYPGVDTYELSTINRRTNTIRVKDSKYGWASALRILIVELYNGNYEVQWNTDEVRASGEVLKTFGGRASGPGPLNDAFKAIVEIFKEANGRKLTSTEAHTIMCIIADAIVVGGVRRSAMISLSNLSDDRMRHVKSGEWWNEHPEYRLANNSAVYTEKPDAETFIREWKALIESKSGERGIFNRAANQFIASRNGRRDTNFDFGCNPCSEIILRSRQFCNLSEIVVRAEDTFDQLARKARIAAFIGTLQATLTNFKYLNPEWRKNTEEEALLGVSLTGIMDHPILSGSYDSSNIVERQNWFVEGSNKYLGLELALQELKQVTIDANQYYAKRLGINPAAAINCIKPSGTVSQLVDCASGIHARFSRYYIRTVRNDIKDPVTKTLIELGFPHEQDVMNPSNMVFSFPIQSPETSVNKDDLTALEQLEIWKTYQLYWCEHKPSCTVYVGDDEWMEVGAWVHRNFDLISGISFLPRSDHVYKQAPYTAITEEEYYAFLDKMPKTGIDINLLATFEAGDMTSGSQEYACSGSGGCEL